MDNIIRDYQGFAITDIHEAFKTHDVVMLAMGTGLGKTVSFMEIIKDFIFNNNRVIMKAHRRELIFQAWETLYNNKIFAGTIMGSEKTNYDLPCQVCSVQTLLRRKDLPPADLIVVDEGHRITDENGYSKIFALYPFAKILIVTATPTRVDGKGFANIVPGKPTKLILSYNLKQGIDNGWLVPLDYYVGYIPDLSNIAIKGGEYEEESAQKAMELAPITQSYFEHAAGKQGVVFAINVAHSKKIVNQYRQAGVAAEHIDGETDPKERKRIIEDFDAGYIKVIVNCAIFTEGTDFKNCEFVQLASPTKSLSRYMQELGRGTRAVRGLVDKYPTAAERKFAISQSAKPSCIVLDNAGLWLEHINEFQKDFDIDWRPHFEGNFKKTAKKDEGEMEILIYVAEGPDGLPRRTANAKEIEGMRLMKVTKEMKRKAVQLKSVKEFERMFNQYDNIKTIKRPGYKAVESYVSYCEKNSFLMVPEIWDYIERYAITRIDEKIKEVRDANAVYPIPEHLLNKSVDNLLRKRISRTWLIGQRTAYAKNNADQLAAYMVSNMDLSI